MIELWVLVAVGGAVMKTAFGTYQKHITTHHNSIELTYILSVVGVVVFLPLMLWEVYTKSIPVTPGIIISIVLKGGLSVVATIAVFKAFETEDMSVFVPLVRVSPLFIVLVEPLFFSGVSYSPTLLLAGVLGVLGAYVVMLNGVGWTEPIRRIREPGPQLALFVAGCSTIGALSIRYAGVEAMPVSTFAFTSNLVMVSLLLVLLHRRNRPISPFAYKQRAFALLGGLSAGREYVIILAYSLATASRVSLVFQLGILFTVIAGGVFFKEEHLLQRFIGALLIILGVVLVTL